MRRTDLETGLRFQMNLSRIIIILNLIDYLVKPLINDCFFHVKKGKEGCSTWCEVRLRQQEALVSTAK